MSINFQNDDEAISSINITPFVDIILVVLIIFMIATPVIMNPGIRVNLPQAASGDTPPASQATISINTTGALFFNGKSVTKEELIQQVGDLVKSNPDAQAILAADKDVSHGVVIEILDQIKIAGIKKFAISIQKK